MSIRLYLSVYIVYYNYLLNSFLESWEIVASRLDFSDGFSDSYISAESRLVDSPDKCLLFVKGIARAGL